MKYSAKEQRVSQVLILEQESFWMYIYLYNHWLPHCTHTWLPRWLRPPWRFFWLLWEFRFFTRSSSDLVWSTAVSGWESEKGERYESLSLSCHAIICCCSNICIANKSESKRVPLTTWHWRGTNCLWNCWITYIPFPRSNLHRQLRSICEGIDEWEENLGENFFLFWACSWNPHFLFFTIISSWFQGKGIDFVRTTRTWSPFQALDDHSHVRVYFLFVFKREENRLGHGPTWTSV